MVDPNRKINRLTEKDIEFLDECEEEFKNRFSTDDEDFIEHCKKEVPTPPIVDPWMSVKKNYDGGNRGSCGGGRGGGRGFRNSHHGAGRYNRHHHSRGGRNFNRHNPYNRSDGSTSGFQRYNS